MMTWESDVCVPCQSEWWSEGGIEEAELWQPENISFFIALMATDNKQKFFYWSVCQLALKLKLQTN